MRPNPSMPRRVRERRRMLGTLKRPEIEILLKAGHGKAEVGPGRGFVAFGEADSARGPGSSRL